MEMREKHTHISRRPASHAATGEVRDRLLIRSLMRKHIGFYGLCVSEGETLSLE